MDFDFADIAQTMAAMPPAPPKPAGKGSTWGGLLSAPLRGIGEAGAQVLGTAADIGSAWRYARDATPEQRRAMDAGGVPVEQFSSDLGDSLRDRGREFRPDPMTAGVAEQLLYGFSRAGSKIVGGTLLAGPAGALAAGIEEGVSAADDLRREGVALEARSKVGAIQGAALAAAVLPVAGPTLKATAGLYLAGGPGGFIAQQAATRAVLKDAGYDEIAQRYDPLDPVGLALSALVPLPFAAWGAARNLRGSTSPKTAPAAADASMPPVVAAERAAPREVVDAAMVHNLTLQQEVHQSRLQGVASQISRGIADAGHGVDEQVLAGAQRLREFVDGPARDQLDNRSKLNVAAVDDKAAARIRDTTGVDIAAGARHEVSASAVRHSANRHPDLSAEDWSVLPWLVNRFDRAVLLKAERGDQGPRIALAALDEATGYAYVAEYRLGKNKGERMSLITFFRDKPGTVENYLRTNGRGGEGGGGGDTPNVPMLPKGPEALTSEAALGGWNESLRASGLGGDAATAMTQAVDHLNRLRAEGIGVEQFLSGASLPGPVQNLLVGLAENGRSPARVAALMRELAKQVSGKGGQPGHTVDLADATATAVERVRSLSDEQIRGTDKPPVAPKSELMLQQVADRVRQLEQQAPDMVVRTDADGHPVTLAEELAAVRREAAEGTDVELGTLDADLLRVAAECAMNLGAL